MPREGTSEKAVYSARGVYNLHKHADLRKYLTRLMKAIHKNPASSEHEVNTGPGTEIAGSMSILTFVASVAYETASGRHLKPLILCPSPCEPHTHWSG